MLITCIDNDYMPDRYLNITYLSKYMNVDPLTTRGQLWFYSVPRFNVQRVIKYQIIHTDRISLTLKAEDGPNISHSRVQTIRLN